MGPIFCISKTVEVKVSQDYRACWQGAWGSHSQDTQFSSLEFSRINSPHNHTSSVKEKIHNFLSLLTENTEVISPLFVAATQMNHYQTHDDAKFTCGRFQNTENFNNKLTPIITTLKRLKT